MSRDRSSPASFSYSDKEDESESFSDSDEDDESASYSDEEYESASFSDSEEEDEPLTMPTLRILVREKKEGLRVRVEAVCGTRKDLLYSNEGFPVGNDHYRNRATTSSNACGGCRCCSKSEEIVELKQKLAFCESYQRQANEILCHQLKMNGSMIEIFNGMNLMFKQNHEMFKRNHEMQQSMMQMIQETRQLGMTKLLPPKQQPMQQQLPRQPGRTCNLGHSLGAPRRMRVRKMHLRALCDRQSPFGDF